MNWVLFIGWGLAWAYFVLLAWYSYWWMRLNKHEAPVSIENLPKISVIIPARNEEETLPQCLKSIAAQEYPFQQVEVIVIDDHSEDNTASVAKNFTNTKILSLSNYTDDKKIGFKKKALTVGVQQALGEIIISTDADCIMDKNWLLSIAHSFCNNPDAQIIAGPVALLPVSGTGLGKKIFSAFQQIDFLMYQGITGGGIRSRLHHLCNGANLAYRKKAFFSVNGYEGNEQQPSGDDVFLMQKISRHFPKAALYLKNEEATVGTAPAKTVHQFIQQRIRWAGKSADYAEISILPIMFLVFLLNLFILIAFFGVIFTPVKTMFGAAFYLQLSGILFLKIASEALLLVPVLRFFKKEKMWFWLIVLQPLHISYTVSSAFLALWGSYEWKGRSFRKQDLIK